MPGPYTQGAQSAEALGEFFVAGQMAAGSVSLAASALTGTATIQDGAGTAFTPDFVLATNSNANTTGNAVGVTISGTTTGLVTFTRATSSAASTVYYIAGNLE